MKLLQLVPILMKKSVIWLAYIANKNIFKQMMHLHYAMHNKLGHNLTQEPLTGRGFYAHHSVILILSIWWINSRREDFKRNNAFPLHHQNDRAQRQESMNRGVVKFTILVIHVNNVYDVHHYHILGVCASRLGVEKKILKKIRMHFHCIAKMTMP